MEKPISAFQRINSCTQIGANSLKSDIMTNASISRVDQNIIYNINQAQIKSNTRNLFNDQLKHDIIA